MAGLLDMLNSPQTAMAAGLLAPTPYGSFGGGVLQGQQAGAAQSQNLQQQQLVKMRIAQAEQEAQQRKRQEEVRKAQLGILSDQSIPYEERVMRASLLGGTQEAIGAANAFKQQGGGTSAIERLISQLPPEEQAKTTQDYLRKQTHIAPQAASSPYYTTSYTNEGTLMTNLRNGEQRFVPYPQGAEGGPTKYDPNAIAQRNYSGQMGTGQAELITDPATEAAKVTAKSQAERAHAMSGVNDTINLAETLLTGKKKPTGSGVGTAYDYVGSIMGFSPSGASEADQLRAIGAALVLKVPRMEGQQSDRDAQLYREAAGQVGDSTVPIERRKAALNAVKDLWSKYEHLQSSDTSVLDEADRILEGK